MAQITTTVALESQAKATLEQVHQMILSMLVTKALDNKVFKHIDSWGENLESIAWKIRASYHHTIMATPSQAVFVRDMIFNLAPVVYWQVVATVKMRHMDIDNVQENSRQVTHEYEIGDQVYVEMTGIYRKFDYRKQGPYIITEVFTNGKVRFQCGKFNERINIRRLKPHFDE